MDLSALFDGTTLGIVVGGTLLATVLRCGRKDVRDTVHTVLRRIFAPPRFDPDAVRSGLARAAQDFQRNGPLRANPRSTGDGEFDDALHALLTHRSIARFDEALAQAREKRLGPVEAAIRTLVQATELAPIFGLAGTLISLSQMPAQGWIGRPISRPSAWRSMPRSMVWCWPICCLPLGAGGRTPCASRRRSAGETGALVRFGNCPDHDAQT
jgi:hypothetical protein